MKTGPQSTYRRYHLNVGTISIITLLSGASVAADNELLEMLLKNGAITKDQYNTLLKKESLKKEDLKATEAKEKTAEKDHAEVKLGDKGLEIETHDGNFKAAIGGRLQWDSQINWNDKDAPANAVLDDGMGVRRGRIHVEGTLYKDFDYKFEYDFVRGSGTTAAGITDAWVKYTFLKPFSITVGQFKEPFSLESVTSNRYLTFIERSLPNNAFIEFANPYKLGISMEGYGKIWTARGAIQAEPIGNGNFTNNSSINSQGNANRNNHSGNTSWDVTGRATVLPWFNGPTELLHLGASGSYRNQNNTFNADGSLRSGAMAFAAQPDTNVDRSSWVNTGALTTAKTAVNPRELDHFVRFGAELAGVYGPFSFQSEYMRTQLSGRGYSSTDVFEGYYAYVSYFLTGESRNYETKRGAFGRQKPFQNFNLGGGWGAWEVAARWDYVNMNTDHVQGGRIQNGTVALNWYLNPHVRLMADYVHIFNVRTFSAPTDIYNGLNPDVLEFRAQVDW